MAASTVERRGTDTSGRGLYASNVFWVTWLLFLADSRLDGVRARIIPVQGAWMVKNGGGAVASKGYHDRGGCWDIRTWNLTKAEIDLVILVASEYGIHFWRRDQAPEHGGMDPHAHAICGWDFDLASGAAVQWGQLKNRRDGLARNGPDYEKRRIPLVLNPPKKTIKENFMAGPEAKEMLKGIQESLSRLETDLDDLRSDEQKRAKAERERDREAAKKAKQTASDLIAALGGLVDRFTEQGDGEAARAVKKILADHPNVDGPDNPVEG